MSRFYRFMLNFGIAVALACLFLTSPAYSLATSDAKIPEGDLLKLGIEKMRHGSYPEAIQDFTEVIKLKKDFAGAYSNRCLAYLQLEDYQNAMSDDKPLRVYADCNQALKFTPNYVEAHLNRGLAYYRQGDYQAAMPTAGYAYADDDQVIALKPDDFRAYYNRGIACGMLGNYTQAISDYNLALTNIPQSSSLLKADVYNDRGLAHFELSDLKTAMIDFSEAIQLNPNDYRAYYNRGCACGRSGDRSCAIRDFTESLKLNSTNAQAYLNRGIAYHQLGHEPAAIADLQKAVEYFAQQRNQSPPIIKPPRNTPKKSKAHSLQAIPQSYPHHRL